MVSRAGRRAALCWKPSHQPALLAVQRTDTGTAVVDTMPGFGGVDRKVMASPMSAAGRQLVVLKSPSTYSGRSVAIVRPPGVPAVRGAGNCAPCRNRTAT